MNTPRSCLILGSGMGGLALGTLLARAGISVTILEAHPSFIGGYAHHFEIDGYSFTAGPRYLWNFGKGQIGYRFLEKCGLLERVAMVELDRQGFDHIYVGNDEPVKVPNGWSAYCALLCERFPKEKANIARFFALGRRVFDAIEVIDDQGLYLEPWHAVIPCCCLHAPRSTAWILANRNLTLEQVFERCGLSSRLRTILYGHGGIFALTAREVSFHAYAAISQLYHRGCYYPVNDMKGFVAALVESIEQHKGTILTNQRVVSVEPTGAGVRQVRTSDGGVFAADVVVVNFDPRQFFSMLGQSGLRSRGRLLDYHYSRSVSSLFLGVVDSRRLAAHFGKWNNWYRASTDEPLDVCDADPRGEPKMMYLNSPTLVKGEPADAPAGAATVTAFAPCSFQIMKQAQSAAREALCAQHRDRLLDLIERRFLPGLRQSLAVVHLRTPDDNERLFQAPQGAIYGRAPVPHEVWRKLPFRSSLPNLYFVGAYVSFAGIASVIHGACRLYQELTGDQV
jgi:all-trans-retinol 13,14-reductase